MSRRTLRLLCAAAAAGAVNGVFGGGGGMVLLPLLSGEKELSGRRLFANSLALMLPVSLLSLLLSQRTAPLPLVQALPYLAGGTVGALIGRRFFDRVSPLWLRRIFALFLLYAAARYLL